MSDLVSATTPRRLGEDRFEIDVPDGWQQGRGAFGGVVVGILARSILAAAHGEGSRTLRSLTATLCGPVTPGTTAVRIERLREGTGVATIAARIEQGGEVQAHAVGTLGKDRAPGTDFCDIPAPPMTPWQELTPVLGGLPGGPAFSRFFEYWPMPPMPFTSHADGAISGWVRPHTPSATLDDAYVATVIDAYWPAIFPRLSAFRPMATLSYTLEVLGDLEGVDPAARLFYTAVAHASRGGYLAEERRLFRPDGRLVARNHQTFVIIK